MNDPTIAVIGTGDFSSYFIAALRNGGHRGRILLSPHSRDKAETIARAHGCEVAENDVRLLDDADWVLIAVRPEQLGRALAPLALRSEQLILSAVAGVSIAGLRQHLGDASTIVRVMPSSYVEAMSDGLIPVFPALPEVRQILARAGTVMAFDAEEHFELATAGACLSGWMYRFMGQLEEWFLGKGLSPDQARLLVLGNIAGAAAYSGADPGRGLGEISDDIATEGTYTRAGLDVLLADGAAGPWLKALDLVGTGLASGRRDDARNGKGECEGEW